MGQEGVLSLSLWPQGHMCTCAGLVGRACPDPHLSQVQPHREVCNLCASFSPRKAPSPCNAVGGRQKLGDPSYYLQSAETFLTGTLHLWGLVLHSIKEVVDPGRLRILPGSLSVAWMPAARGWSAFSPFPKS